MSLAITIYFGLSYDENVLPYPTLDELGTYYFGPQRFLEFLEKKLGLSGYLRDNSHLRIEQFRQILSAYVKEEPEAFFKNSLEVDPLATSATILEMRDNLLNAEFSFEPEKKIPIRLRQICELEKLITKGREQPSADIPSLVSGVACRIEKAIEKISRPVLGIAKLYVNEPTDLLPNEWLKLINALSATGLTVGHNELKTLAVDKTTDLSAFANGVTDNQISSSELKADGSLLIMRADTETDAAAYISELIRLNPAFSPSCLLPEKQRTLDRAFHMRGLPDMGIPSASLARPSLQLLKLIPVFFWRPLDPYKVLEFVTLPSKPLPDELSNPIAEFMSQRPGTNSAAWYAMIASSFEKIENKPGVTKREIAEAKEQFSLWFDRKRSAADEEVSASEVIFCYRYVQRWAQQAYEKDAEKNATFLSLSEQAAQVCDLLESLPEREKMLTPLRLEQIIRTIYSPSPISIQQAALDHSQYTHQESAFYDSVDTLVWWNFLRKEPIYFFSRWYADEIAYLNNLACFPYSPVQQSKLHVWKSRQPLKYVKEQLILVIPNTVQAEQRYAHALHDMLEAQFSDLSAITVNASNYNASAVWQSSFTLPEPHELETKSTLKKPASLQLVNKPVFPNTDRPEYITDLERFCFYPHQWMFKYHARLRKLPLLSVIRENTLMGNLAHRFFELLLKDLDTHLDNDAIHRWFEKNAPVIFDREGTPMLLYGREPQKRAFLSTLKKSAAILLHHIFENNWKITGTELTIEGNFNGIQVRGKVDLALERGSEKAIVDLKWRGSRYYKNVINNGEDLQLALYNHLYSEREPSVHTAYFILQNGEMIARDNAAFTDCLSIGGNQNNSSFEQHKELCERIAYTLEWRQEQLKKGFVELRTADTVDELEAYYTDFDMKLLEMKTTDASFDDFAVLLSSKLT